MTRSRVCLSEIKRKTRRHQRKQIGHWSRECPQRKAFPEVSQVQTANRSRRCPVNQLTQWNHIKVTLKPNYHFGAVDSKKKKKKRRRLQRSQQRKRLWSHRHLRRRYSDDSDLISNLHDLEDVVMTDSDAETPLVLSQECHICKGGRLYLSVHKPSTFFLWKCAEQKSNPGRVEGCAGSDAMPASARSQTCFFTIRVEARTRSTSAPT